MPLTFHEGKTTMRRTWAFIGAALTLLTACGQSAGGTGSASPSTTGAPSKPTASATSALSATASASAAAAVDDVCKAHKLTFGGAGTKADPCKFDSAPVTARYAAKFEDDGVLFTITNPWPDDVTAISAGVFYYDRDDRQVVVTVNGKEAKADLVEGAAVSVPGNKSADVHLGLAKKDLPEGVISADITVVGFVVKSDKGDAYFVRKAEWNDNNRRNELTGIPDCDAYLKALEGCQKKLPDAYAAAKKTLAPYNDLSVAAQKRTADQMAATCSSGMAAIMPRCTPDD